MLPAGIFTASEKHLFEHASRVHPIYFEYPLEKIDDIAIDLPNGWQIDSVPLPQIKDGHIVTYDMKVVNDKNQVHITRKLTIDFLLLDTKYYASLRNFFQMIRSGDEAQVLLQSGTANASN